jgi:hypothetical protein
MSSSTLLAELLERPSGRRSGGIGAANYMPASGLRAGASTEGIR